MEVTLASDALRSLDMAIAVLILHEMYVRLGSLDGGILFLNYSMPRKYIECR